MPTILQIGQAQFDWLGKTELVLMVLLAIALLRNGSSRSALVFVIPIGLFLVQQLLIMPSLNTATSLRISGEANTLSHAHVTYVILEMLKFLGLIAASIIYLNRS